MGRSDEVFSLSSGPWSFLLAAFFFDLYPPDFLNTFPCWRLFLSIGGSWVHFLAQSIFPEAGYPLDLPCRTRSFPTAFCTYFLQRSFNALARSVSPPASYSLYFLIRTVSSFLFRFLIHFLLRFYAFRDGSASFFLLLPLPPCSEPASLGVNLSPNRWGVVFFP